MNRGTSFARRALLAVVLTVGFYLLSLTIAGVLLSIPYLDWVYLGQIHFKVAFFCIAGAGIILWSILPRPDRFEAPGPVISKAAEPRLFAELEKLALAAGQALPVHVYAIAEVNAWVSSRGGILGFGSKPMMGLGLPLIQLLSTQQFDAVLAHEFGHYYGGDTRLGPWIYRTRIAIERTLVRVAGHSGLLAGLFSIYWKIFLRLTHAVSRQQEFTADQLSARITSPATVIQALRLIHQGAIAFNPFWENELAPVLGAGYRPPLSAGFKQFIQTPEIERNLIEATSDDVFNGQTDPYDTHPSLPERIQALESLPVNEKPGDDTPAIDLISNLDDLEEGLLSFLSRSKPPVSLQRIDWEDVGEKIYLPQWQELVQKYRSHLDGMTVGAISASAADLKGLGWRMRDPKAQAMTEEQRIALAGFTLASALAVALYGEGWSLSALAGSPVKLKKGTIEIQPFKIVEELSISKMPPTEWHILCESAGIERLPLV